MNLSAEAVALLLERGRSRGRLGVDDVVAVLGNTLLTSELIHELTEALTAAGIELDDIDEEPPTHARKEPHSPSALSNAIVPMLCR